MLPLFDMMLQAQNGQAMTEMAKQFGLAQEQAKVAMAALMPAFATGLKQSATNPYDFSSLMTAAASGGYAKYFEDVTKAFTPEGVSDGNNLLGQLFGSKEMSRAIAAQAEKMSGISQDVYKQMLPVMANSIVGGFFKQIAGQFQSAGEAMAAGRPADIYQDWMRSVGLAEKKPQPNPFLDNPLMQGWQAMMGGQASAPQNAVIENPFMKMFEAMTGMGTQQASTPDQPSADTSSQGNQYMATFEKMFETGVEVQKNYQKSVEEIFEKFMPSPKSTS